MTFTRCRNLRNQLLIPVIFTAIAWAGALSIAAGSQPPVAAPVAPAAVPDAMSGQRKIIEELDKISQNNLKLQFPQFSIKVLGTELVDGELLFRIKMLATQGAATIYTDHTQTTEIVSGRLRKLAIEGYLTIPGMAQEAKLRVKPGKFTLDLTATSATMPTELGGAVAMKNRYVDIVNTTELLIGTKQRRGTLKVLLTETVLDRVNLVFAGPAGRDTLTLTSALRMPKQSEWAADMETGRVRWVDGRIVATDLSLTYDSPEAIAMSGFQTGFRSLFCKSLEILKTRSANTITTSFADMRVDVGELKITGGVTVDGRFATPLELAGRWSGELSEDGQIGQNTYDLTRVKASLSVATLADKNGNQFTGGAASVDLKSLTPKTIDGSLQIDGGEVKLAGTTNGTVSVNSLQLAVSGPLNALNGQGSLALNSFTISTEVHAQVLDRCTSTMPIKLNGMKGESVQGQAELRAGALAYDVRMDEFSGNVGLGYYRCEYDQKVGDLGRWEVVWDTWCPTWSEPARTCQQRWVIWEGGPVMVAWVVEKQPTLIDTNVAISDLRVRSNPAEDGGKLRLCGGRLKWVSPNVNWFTWNPTVRANGPVGDLFKAAVNAIGYAISSSVSTFLGIGGAIFGMSGIHVFTC